MVPRPRPHALPRGGREPHRVGLGPVRPRLGPVRHDRLVSTTGLITAGWVRWVQLGALLVGHVAAVVLAHDGAIGRVRSPPGHAGHVGRERGRRRVRSWRPPCWCSDDGGRAPRRPPGRMGRDALRPRPHLAVRRAPRARQQAGQARAGPRATTRPTLPTDVAPTHPHAHRGRGRATGPVAERTDVVVERADGPGRFVAVGGPFAGYERTLTRDGDQVTEVLRYRLAGGYGRFPFSWLHRRTLRRAGRPGPPWWAPPEVIDARPAPTIGSLCAIAVVAGYLGTLLTQTITFAADEFDASKTAQSTVARGRAGRGAGHRLPHRDGRPPGPTPAPAPRRPASAAWPARSARCPRTSSASGSASSWSARWCRRAPCCSR